MGEVVNLDDYRPKKEPDPSPFLFSGNAGDRPCDTEDHDAEPA